MIRCLRHESSIGLAVGLWANVAPLRQGKTGMIPVQGEENQGRPRLFAVAESSSACASMIAFFWHSQYGFFAVSSVCATRAVSPKGFFAMLRRR